MLIYIFFVKVMIDFLLFHIMFIMLNLLVIHFFNDDHNDNYDLFLSLYIVNI